jgi:pantetheine-phosphate adenylyltransferase
MQVSNKGSRLAVYAGTFDPITNGHIDIIKRALIVFDSICVAVAKSPSKKVTFDTETRLRLVSDAVKDVGIADKVIVDSFEGLLVDYVSHKGAVAIVRGLRAVTDYEYEAQMALMNRRLSENVETVFFVASENCSFISSSIVKNVAENGGQIDGLVPKNVSASLKSLNKYK